MKWSCAIVLGFLSTASIQFTGKKKHYTYDLRLAPTLFEEFQAYYKKNYSEKEKKIRSKVFYDNLVRINAINQNFPGNWSAVIGPYADLTYLEYTKLNNITKAEYKNFGGQFRNVINCTDRRGYIFERFSNSIKQRHDATAEPEYYTNEEVTTDNGTVSEEYEYYSDEEETVTSNGKTLRKKKKHDVKSFNY